MCFIRQQYPRQTALKAKEDIITFKILKKRSRGLCSPYYHSAWEKDKMVYGKLPKEIEADEVDIYTGIHSLKTIHDAIKFIDEHSLLAGIYKIRIPKGSLYYENKTQIVSNKAILVNNRRVSVKGK